MKKDMETTDECAVAAIAAAILKKDRIDNKEKNNQKEKSNRTMKIVERIINKIIRIERGK